MRMIMVFSYFIKNMPRLIKHRSKWLKYHLGKTTSIILVKKIPSSQYQYHLFGNLVLCHFVIFVHTSSLVYYSVHLVHFHLFLE